MKIHLAGFGPVRKAFMARYETEEEALEALSNVYLLTSFWEIYGNVKRNAIPFYIYQERHMLDSGAFSFIKGNNSENIDWDEYIGQYVKCIKETNQKYFFELDVDFTVGIERVEEFRDRIEQAVGRATIPVWHKSRGKEYWLRLVEEYDYVSIAGFASKHIKRREHKYLTWFLETARKNNCKVHGLGFTGFAAMHKYPFYSVDSTSWLSCAKFGGVSTAAINKDGQRVLVKRNKGDGIRCKNTADLYLLNFDAWVSYQKYAEKYL